MASLFSCVGKVSGRCVARLLTAPPTVQDCAKRNSVRYCMPKRSHRYRRLVAALAAVVVPRASALCTGIAHESKACRRPRESNTRTVLPLPADDATDNMTDLELVLKQYGMSGLRLLNVSYAGAGGAKLRGAGTRVDNGHAAWVGAEPDIQWNRDCIAMVLMVDPDCGGRRSTAPEQWLVWPRSTCHVARLHGRKSTIVQSAAPRTLHQGSAMSRQIDTPFSCSSRGHHST